MKAYIIPTSNIMTTAYYYSLLKRIFEVAGFETVLCENGCLKGYKVDRRKDIIMTGHPFVTLKLKARGFKNVCTWYQGVTPEERIMQGYSRFYIFLYEIMERMSLRLDSFGVFVSESLVKHFNKKYKMRVNSSRFAVMPCFNDSQVNLRSFETGVKKPFSFVYSGGMGVWQCFSETLDVFKLLKKRIPEATLDIYTYQVDKAKDIVASNGIKDVEVSYVPKEEMNQALSDKMFGFVLRDDNVVNRVATPTKFSNYIANGIIPIFSNCVEDFAAASNKMKYAIPIDRHDVEGIVEEIIPKAKVIVETYDETEHKRECDKMFASYYSVDEYVKTVSVKIRALFKTNER